MKTGRDIAKQANRMGLGNLLTSEVMTYAIIEAMAVKQGLPPHDNKFDWRNTALPPSISPETTIVASHMLHTVTDHKGPPVLLVRDEMQASLLPLDCAQPDLLSKNPHYVPTRLGLDSQGMRHLTRQERQGVAII